MEEIEVPTEKLNEEINEHAAHAKERWISQVALSSALIAVFAAIAALLSGHHSNEAMIEQIKASDKWAYYQAKGIKSSLLNAKMEILTELGKPAKEEDRKKSEEYKTQQEEINKEATEREELSEKHLNSHQIYAKSVTFFQVAIAIAAISVLMRRRKFWYLSLAFGAAGVGFFIQALLS
ncbi:MAG: DUF4337 domain-containing protein [Pseudobdellovibrionaceae bacterium]